MKLKIHSTRKSHTIRMHLLRQTPIPTQPSPPYSLTLPPKSLLPIPSSPLQPKLHPPKTLHAPLALLNQQLQPIPHQPRPQIILILWLRPENIHFKPLSLFIHPTQLLPHGPLICILGYFLSLTSSFTSQSTSQLD